MRLQRVLAAAGLGSRRACEEIIRAGRVTVDGRVAELGATVEPDHQLIAVDGHPLRGLEEKQYWLLNKANGVVSTAKDPQGRPTVVDCVPTSVRVVPVGRLDQETTGVLLLTNDGDLTYRLLHPRYGVEKEYLVVARGSVPDDAVRRLEEGIQLEDGPTAPARVRIARRSEKETELVMVIHEGRKRQVRRMLEAVGHPVTRLHRRRVAGLTDHDLALGAARRLTAEEVASLWAAAGAERAR